MLAALGHGLAVFCSPQQASRREVRFKPHPGAWRASLLMSAFVYRPATLVACL